MHREIRKYIYTEFFKNKENFYIEDELFNITKIHNNKVHTTTKRIPKEIRDILDITEIEHINQEILKTLKKKNKNYDIIDYNKGYVFDYNKVYIINNQILKKRVRLIRKQNKLKFL